MATEQNYDEAVQAMETMTAPVVEVSELDTLRDERDAALLLAEENERMTIPALVQAAHATATAKGWHEDPSDFGVKLMLAVGELSEAMECYRDGLAPQDFYYQGVIGSNNMLDRVAGPGRKPEGIPVEIADCIIRLFDTCGFYGIDLNRAITEKMAYNMGRSHRHGGKIV